MKKYKDIVTKKLRILICNRCKKEVKEDDYIENLKNDFGG